MNFLEIANKTLLKETIKELQHVLKYGERQQMTKTQSRTSKLEK